MSRTYGAAELRGQTWNITAEPHVMMMVKRVFTGLQRQYGTLKISNTEANAELLEWLMMRYPLEITSRDKKVLDGVTIAAREKRVRGDVLIRGGTPADVCTLIPLRPYQLLAIELLKIRTSLLVGDDLGLGKTCVALGGIAAGLQPAIVVCKTHLQLQWKAEAEKFLFGVKAHIVKKMKPYSLPDHNLLIITYSKLAGWAETLKGYQLIAFDEAQELRRSGTDKYSAAKHLARNSAHRLGLTATPVYNYGDEIFSLINLLAPKSLGTHTEFLAEWCTPMGNHYKVNDPDALGSHLAENHLFLRRRRAEVGRELPPVTKIVDEVQYDEKRLLAMEGTALQLAKTILRGTWEERGKASLELDALMRQQTGLAKAPYVAEFVQQLVEAGE
ncbi:MAG TPA: SNF2-related protein, partial [Candidatus Methylacidiphilales bacterium]|nr:SNF2-related protein [Candidatus Methylacidiphilales bacterium]